nr:DUF2207 domain-containing protein [Saprospiraceae bacterium]
MGDTAFIRWLFIFLVGLFCFPRTGSAEAFTIQQYDVEISLNRDGSFDVTETIDLNFHEERRGIIRSVPVIYKQGDRNRGDAAIRPIGTEMYQIVIEDLRVDDWNFVTYIEGDFLNIRIGDANKTIKGKQQYRISYKVWGGLNEFSDRVEFTWNVIGNEWNTTIEKATFSIRAEDPVKFREGNTIWYTGRPGATQKNAEVTVSNQVINGVTKERLRPKEGISFATRHDKSHFKNIHIPIEKLADKLVVRSQEYQYQLSPPGKFEVNEVFSIEFLNEVKNFTRRVGVARKSAENGLMQYPYIQDIALNYPGNEIDFNLLRNGNYTEINFFKTDGTAFTGELSIELEYDFWGSLTPTAANPQYLLLPSTFSGGEPVESIVVSAQKHHLNEPPSAVFNNYRNNFSSGANDSDFSLSYAYPQFRVEYGVLTGSAHRNAYDPVLQPDEIWGNHYMLAEMDIDLHVNSEQGVQFTSRYEVLHPIAIPGKTFQSIYPWRITSSSDFFNGEMKVSGWNLLDRRVVPKSSFSSETGEFQRYRNGHMRRSVGSGILEQSSWTNSEVIEYRGLYSARGGEQYVTVPVAHKSDELRKKVRLNVSLSDDIDPTFVEMTLLVDEKTVIPLIQQGRNFVLPQTDFHLLPGQSAVVSIKGPEGFSGTLPLGTQLQLLVRNNIPLWFIFGVIFLLYFLWNKIGRNPREAVVVQYYPPKTITSAEAGLLWDDKLHRKDLISLIYYWAGRGHLEVEEIMEGKKPDYILRKIKDLPKDAKLFEKTFFKGLFLTDEVKISNLKSKFAHTMRLAHKDLMKHSKTNDFYVPGSRGFGCGLSVFGIILLFLGVFGLGISFFTGHWSYGVAPIVIGASMVYFGRIMPKKGPFGFK